MRIDALRTTESQRAYLTELLRLDQEYRDRELTTTLVAQHGYDSPKMDSFRRSFMLRDLANFAKAHYYVRYHGYPDPDSVGSHAARAPWLVFHHTHYRQYQRENYDTLAAAHRRGGLEDDMLAFYLGRAYRDRFGRRHVMPNPYTPARELDTLARLLGWDEPSTVGVTPP